MKNNSIWLDNIEFKKEKQIDSSMSVDVLIIGAGMTGLSTAYHLIESGLNVCVVERNGSAQGISSRTTGKLTFLQDKIYSDLMKGKCLDKSKLYLESQLDAIKMVKKIVDKNKIECNYKECTSYVYTNQKEEIKNIKKEKNILEKLGINVKEHRKLPIITDCKYAISVGDTAVFHPVKYLLVLKKICINSGIKIFEDSKVEDIDKEDNHYICHVNKFIVKAKKVVIACHYPYFLVPFFTPLKVHIEKSYLSASITNSEENFSAITSSKPINSIRYYCDKNKYFIFLNGSHELCSNYNYSKNFDNLKRELGQYKLKTKFIWSNHDIMTNDNLPFIGYIDDNMLMGTGYNTWGMTNGSLAGKILSDLILKKNNEYVDLFDPKRGLNIKKILSFPIDMSGNAKSFLESKICKNKKWYGENVFFENRNGKNIGVYIDENNIEHVVYNLCPHLKCSLIFNEVEKTWDCPCHGSRFDIDGKCIFGPSNYDISYKK